MATIPEVKIKISGDPKGFAAAIKTAQGALGQLNTNLARVQALSARAFSFAGVGGAASVAGLIAIAKSTADIADEMGKLAQRTGVGVESLSRLAYAADLSGATIEDLSAGLRRLGDDAGDGGKNLAAAGISLVDAGGKAKTTEQLFAEVADRFASLPDGIQKTNLAVTLFGKNIGSQLTPLLNLGSKGLKELADESDRFGKTITDSQVAASEAFNDNLTRLQALAQGTAIELGTALIPAMNDLALAFLQAIQEDRKIGASDGLKSFADTAATAVGFVVDAVDGFIRVVQVLGRGIGGLAASAVAALSGDLKLARQIFDEADRDLDEILNKRQFSDRLREQQSQEVRAAQGTADIQKKLTAAILKEQGLRLKASQEAGAEELKGVERLRDALRTAWQVSIDGARKARDEAKELLTQAADARTGGVDAANARRARGNKPEQNDRDARVQAERARSEANTAASSSVIAAFQGRLAESKKLSDEALKQAERAERLAENIISDTDAARLLEQIGVIREDALKAQAQVKQKEALELEAVAKSQNDQILKAEERIKALKAELEKPVTITTEIEQAVSNLKALQAELDKVQDKTVTVTVNTVAAGGDVQTIDLPSGPVTPGFSGGGYTGAGGKYQPAGIVHAGEFVLRQEVVRQRGMRSLLDRLNMQGINALAERGYANGGMVTGSAPTPINLHWPDGTTSRVSAEKSVAEQIARTFRGAALSRGRRS